MTPPTTKVQATLPDAPDLERAEPRSASPTSRWRGQRLGALLALLLLTIGPLLPTLRAAFVYDDTTMIRDNVLIRGWSALGRVWSQPYWPSDGGVDLLGLYRPLQVALLAAVWNLGGGSPKLFHLYALALAVAAVLCVWWTLRHGVAWGAALVAAIWFASHPLHVEAIASVANTSELVVLLCIVALVRLLDVSASVRVGDAALHVEGVDDESFSWPRALLVGVVAAAALLAKESGLLAVPIAAVTVWGWRRADALPVGTSGFVRTRMRAWAAALVAIVAVLLARSAVLGALVAPPSIAAQGLESLGTSARVPLMLSIWPRIATMLVWPTSLAPYYGPTIFPASRTGYALLSVIVVLAVLALAVLAAQRGDRRPLVAVTWIALTYFPASNLASPTGQILADRTLFGATVGVALALAWALDRLPRLARVAALIVVALLVARNAVVSTRYAVAWTSHRALWTRLVESEPAEHLGYKLLGMDARARGDTAQALELLSRAYAMTPTDRQIRFEYGQALYSAQRYGSAAQVLAPLMKDADARGERALVALYLDAVGRSAGAAAVAREATPLLHGESAPEAALYLGLAQERLGDRAAADSAFTAGLRRAPGDTALLARRDALRAATPNR